MKEILRNEAEKRITYKKNYSYYNYSYNHKIETSLRNKKYRETHAEEISDKRRQRYELNQDKILVQIREKHYMRLWRYFQKKRY